MIMTQQTLTLSLVHDLFLLVRHKKSVLAITPILLEVVQVDTHTIDPYYGNE